MMPTLPPPLYESEIDDAAIKSWPHEGEWVGVQYLKFARRIEELCRAQMADYGRAIAEACAVICMKLVDSDDPAQCAHEIRKAVKEIGR